MEELCEPSINSAENDRASLSAGTATNRSWIEQHDPYNPRNFSAARKWTIVVASFLATLLVPMNGTSITAATAEISASFDVSNHPFPNSYWTVFTWTIGGAVFVLIGIPLMEDIGVRRSFLVLYACFILMVIPQAVAKNYATLVISRIFSGGCVALLANTASSVIPDVWATERERSLPISIWILCYTLGNTLGPPVFAGVVRSSGNWRWIFYAQLIIYGSLFPFFWVFLQETRNSVILARKAKSSILEKRAGGEAFSGLHFSTGYFKRLARSAARPLYLLFTEPVLMACTLWSGFSFGTVYMFTQSVEQVYSQYGWNSWNINYVISAVAVGEVVGFCWMLYGTRLYFNSASRNTEFPGHPIPEARLYASALGSSVGIAGGMFVYAWTDHVHWIFPTIGLAMVGFGMQTVLSSLADYIEDAYASSNYAASAIAACAAGENIFAGCLPLATSSMYTQLGNQWASTLLGCLALVLSLAPILIIWKGRWFRERSPFMLSKGQTFTVR